MTPDHFHIRKYNAFPSWESGLNGAGLLQNKYDGERKKGPDDDDDKGGC